LFATSRSQKDVVIGCLSFSREEPPLHELLGLTCLSSKEPRITMNKFNKGDWVYHRYKQRLGFVVITPKIEWAWVTVLFVGDDTPHDAYVNFLERAEVENE
jgi:hypothetical protein